ncbi:MAG: T9SS type A sorting domain-containing protein [Lacibacter sp.]
MKTMKTLVALPSIIAISFSVDAQNRNLPHPDANLQSFPAGSYVIAMDNTLQLNASNRFNLRTYGLIVHLLNNNVPLKWVIRSGKQKDAADFTADAEQILPTLVPGGVSRGFRAGPFVIHANDTAGVAALVTGFYTANNLTGNNRPRIYRLTAPANNVDVRYDMTGFIPKAAILNDGNNTNIHLAFMTNCSIPSSNYAVSDGFGLLNRCFNFASEPHNSTSNNSLIAAIRQFVRNGGNFLAQCEAIVSYENNINGRFHTNNGITAQNATVSLANTAYLNPDLSYSQFEGGFNMSLTGSVRNWVTVTGSSFINNAHAHASASAGTPIGAGVAKLTAPEEPGGMVFYLGNHNFTDLNSVEQINGIRMYMNAMLTPTAINVNCATGDPTGGILPVAVTSFTVTLPAPRTVVLSWEAAVENTQGQFFVQRSADGILFENIGAISFDGTNSALRSFLFTDSVHESLEDKFYYRLYTVEANSQGAYSDVRSVRLNQNVHYSNRFTVYPNPAQDVVYVVVPEKWRTKQITYSMYSANGNILRSATLQDSRNPLRISLDKLTPGFYLLRLICNSEVVQHRIFKQ